MKFTRGEDYLDTLQIGKRQRLEIISSGSLFIGSHTRSSVLIDRGFSGEEAGELLKKLESGKIGKKFIINFSFNVNRIHMEKGDYILFRFYIKEENLKGKDYNISHGEFIYEHDNKIYNIPEQIELVDDLWFSFKPWNIKHLSCEIRKASRKYKKVRRYRTSSY